MNSDLGFSERDRNENIRRIGEVAKLFADSATIAITSFISPYRKDRETARATHAAPVGPGEKKTNKDGSVKDLEELPFIEVWIDCPVEEAEKRDPKGLYKKARAGEIKEFTGISAPYEEPEAAEIHIRSDQCSVEESVAEIVNYLQEKDLIPPKAWP